MKTKKAKIRHTGEIVDVYYHVESRQWIHNKGYDRDHYRENELDFEDIEDRKFKKK